MRAASSRADPGLGHRLGTWPADLHGLWQRPAASQDRPGSRPPRPGERPGRPYRRPAWHAGWGCQRRRNAGRNGQDETGQAAIGSGGSIATALRQNAELIDRAAKAVIAARLYNLAALPDRRHAPVVAAQGNGLTTEGAGEGRSASAAITQPARKPTRIAHAPDAKGAHRAPPLRGERVTFGRDCGVKLRLPLSPFEIPGEKTSSASPAPAAACSPFVYFPVPSESARRVAFCRRPSEPFCCPWRGRTASGAERTCPRSDFATSANGWASSAA